MKKIVKLLPFLIGILLLGYAFYARYKISGFGIFDLDTETGLFYVSTYKYAAIGGASVLVIYVTILIGMYKKRSGKKEV